VILRSPDTSFNAPPLKFSFLTSFTFFLLICWWGLVDGTAVSPAIRFQRCDLQLSLKPSYVNSSVFSPPSFYKSGRHSLLHVSSARSCPQLDSVRTSFPLVLFLKPPPQARRYFRGPLSCRRGPALDNPTRSTLGSHHLFQPFFCSPLFWSLPPTPTDPRLQEPRHKFLIMSRSRLLTLPSLLIMTLTTVSRFAHLVSPSEITPKCFRQDPRIVLSLALGANSCIPPIPAFGVPVSRPRAVNLTSGTRLLHTTFLLNYAERQFRWSGRSQTSPLPTFPFFFDGLWCCACCEPLGGVPPPPPAPLASAVLSSIVCVPQTRSTQLSGL